MMQGDRAPRDADEAVWNRQDESQANESQANGSAPDDRLATTRIVPEETATTLLLSMLPGVGPRTLTALLDRFGSAAKVLKAPETQLAGVYGVGP
ncbi:MAG: helix-hairpin-helix domain-containing protein, partial [Novipirellula sp. JB048]